MTESRLNALRAVAQGAAQVVGAPHLVLMVAIVTVVMAAPFAALLGSRLNASLATQPPVALDETEIDPEWWQEYRAHARGLEATFTPAVLGFAATLDGLSAVLDGRRPPLPVLGPLALSIAVWSLLWGGLLRRFAATRAIGARAFVSASAQLAPRFFGIALIAATIIGVLYLTLHTALFGPVYRLLAPADASELNRFVVRVLLYLVFLIPLAFVGLAADYARAASVTGVAGSLGQSWRAGVTFLRANARAAITVYLLIGAMFVAVTIAYGTLEIYGGSQVGGWRAIVIGQVYIVARLVLRLTSAAAGLRLFAARATP